MEKYWHDAADEGTFEIARLVKRLGVLLESPTATETADKMRRQAAGLDAQDNVRAKAVVMGGDSPVESIAEWWTRTQAGLPINKSPDVTVADTIADTIAEDAATDFGAAFGKASTAAFDRQTAAYEDFVRTTAIANAATQGSQNWGIPTASPIMPDELTDVAGKVADELANLGDQIKGPIPYEDLFDHSVLALQSATAAIDDTKGLLDAKLQGSENLSSYDKFLEEMRAVSQSAEVPIGDSPVIQEIGDKLGQSIDKAISTKVELPTLALKGSVEAYQLMTKWQMAGKGTKTQEEFLKRLVENGEKQSEEQNELISEGNSHLEAIEERLQDIEVETGLY